MHYIIDAYNLIGKINKISFSDPEKEKNLIDFLKQRQTNKKDKFTLIFDNKNQSHPYGSKTKNQNFTIILPP